MINKLKQYKWYRIIKNSDCFDAKFYLFSYLDVRKKDIDPIWHYIKFGANEGRNPSADFNTKYYINTYADVRKSHMNPLVHYILYGKKEGRMIKKVIKKMRENGLKESIKLIHNKLLSKKYDYIEPILNRRVLREMSSFEKKPLVSIVMPVYNVKPKWLNLAIQSICEQWYSNWELCIVDDKSTNQDTIDYLKKLRHSKIKVKFLDINRNISFASNKALEMANGSYIALMDNDDEITPDALYEVVKVINEKQAEFVYSDEDKLEINGSYSDPHFKPDFAPDMFLSQNYISHLGVIKKDLIDKVGGFTVGLEGSQDYDLYLKVLEHTDKIYHIQKVLYHWRKVPGSTATEFSDKSYAQETGRKALQNTMQRRGIEANILNGKYPGTYKVEYSIKNNPLVSIVIPFKDKPELLTMCIESILKKTTYRNFEIIGISNNSTEKNTFNEMKRLENMDNRIKFYEYNIPFNYSKINNYAIRNYAKGKHVILLNNDIEIITPRWIEEMLMHSQREQVGAVGAKLYYPNDTIQHAGVIIGIGGVAGHAHKHFSGKHAGYFARLHLVQNFSAVTAACLMVKKSIYDEIGGFNEKDLKVAFNDVDFCLRVQEKRYKNIYTPYCEAYHYESISRGYEDTRKKKNRFKNEVLYIQKRYKKLLEEGDRYYNPNLTLEHQDFSLKSKYERFKNNEHKKINHKVLYLHAGGGKTGSSALQNFLHNNQNALQKLGYSYSSVSLENKLDYKITSGNGVVLCEAIKACDVDEIKIILKKLFAREQKAICSSEVFEILNRKEWLLIFDICKQLNIDIKIIFYVRNIDEYLSSGYDQLIKRHSLSLEFDDYVEKANWLHYKTLRVLHEVDFDSDIVVESYNRVKDKLLYDFLVKIGIDKNFFDLFALSIKTVNRSLINQERRLLREINKIYQNDDICTQLSDVLISLNPEIKSEKININLNTKKKIKTHFANKVKWINDIYFHKKNIIQIFSSVSSKEKQNNKDVLNANKVVTLLEENIKKRSVVNDAKLPKNFDPLYYLIANRDVLLQGINPEEHYIKFGQKEGRRYDFLQK